VIGFIAYIPFLYPIGALHEWWYFLLIPLAFGVSVIYKAMRLPRLDEYWRRVAVMTIQIVLVMVALAVGLAVLIQVVIPLLPVGA
jgi:hypothetical protein